MAKYKSKRFLELFKSFEKLFKVEGDVYESIKESIVEQHEHSMLPVDIEEKIVLSILRDAAAEYYKNNIEILTEDKYIEYVTKRT